MKFIYLTIFKILICVNSFAQWKKVNDIPLRSMSAIANMKDTLYAASGNHILYKSTDNNKTWHPITISTLPIEIYTLKIIDKVIYVGTTNQGIFTSVNFGKTWTNFRNDLFWISGFEKFNDNVFASTIGSGVYIYNRNKNNWFPFNNQLPYNLAYNVETIVTTSNNLLIGAGGNGMLFNYDYSTDGWVYGYYYGKNSPGLVIQKIINQSDTLFAVDGRRVLRSNNEGLNWIEDHKDSRSGVSRLIHSGKTNIYIVTNLLNNNSWIQRREKNAVLGTSWAVDEELTNYYVYDVFEFKNKLFLATHQGLYFKFLTEDTYVPDDPKIDLLLFPNPSNGQTIHIICEKNIDSYSIINGLGQNVHSRKVNKNTFTIEKNLTKGVYYVSVYFTDGQVMSKKIVVN